MVKDVWSEHFYNGIKMTDRPIYHIHAVSLQYDAVQSS